MYNANIIKLCFLLSIFVFSTTFSQTSTPPASGDGSSGSPYQIASLENLYWLSQQESNSDGTGPYWSRNYIQTADIDLTGSGSWDSNNGFTPIGNQSTKFTGSYNGQEYTISNLRISRAASDYIGLFGYTTGATIQQLSVTNVNITGNNNVGVFVGYNHSTTISNCNSDGTLYGNIVCGGLVGQNISSSAISKCFTDVDVNANNIAGGFVGGNSSSTIRNCYSLFGVTSRVPGEEPTNLGAFCGNHGNNSDSKIEYCYSIGGVGFIDVADPTNRGFIAVNNSGGYLANFFDTGVSNQTTGTGATSEITNDMKTSSTFTDAGWSGSIWNRDDGVNNGYPHLDWQNPGGTPLPVELTFFEGTATEEGVLLKWETATEINNYGFNVELRIANGEWQKRGFVQGHGTTNSPKEYSFTDTDLPDAESADYRLKQIDNDGIFAYSKTITVDLTTITSTDDEVVHKFFLDQNYPNPFNPTTTIKFTVPNIGDAYHASLNTKLIIYDILGREVVTLVNQKLQSGNHEVNFDANALSSGLYFYRMTIGNKFNSTKKMLLLK